MVAGFDNLCGTPTTFAVRSDNYRDDLFSAVTGSFARQRGVVCGLSLALFGEPDVSLPEIGRHVNELGMSVYLAESDSSLAAAFRAAIDPALLTVSEYFGPEVACGSVIDGVAHVDLHATPFPDGRFDIMVTADVMEHVADAPRAEREIVRVLARGGIYCFTAPFGPRLIADRVRAEHAPTGEIIHHYEPMYHDAPGRGRVVLVYRIFSQPGLRSRFEALGCRFETVRLWSSALGIIGGDAWVHIVRKP